MITAAAPTSAGGAAPARLRPLPGLDGLRALAVVAVIAYHLDASILPGGYLGVDIFFVISGYLITALLLAEYTQTSGIGFVAFWKRRARRLLPALAALLLGVVILASLFGRDALDRLQSDLPSSVFYTINWRLVLQHDSYLASMGRPPLLLHLWSLSVEEQFYLLWPLAVVLLRRRLSRTGLARAALAGAILSALLMAMLYRGGDPSAVYFGTETHATGLLLGSALAAAVAPWRMRADIADPARRVLDRAGLAALLAVVFALAALPFDVAATYRGGILLADAAATLLVITVAHPATTIGRAFAGRRLRWVGRRSYSLYLWHWPIFELTRPGVDVHLPGLLDGALRLGLTVVAADLSYRYVEQPWRSGVAQARIRRLVAAGRVGWLAGGSVAAAGMVAVLLVTAPQASAPPILLQGSTEAARMAPGLAALTPPATTGPWLAPLVAPTTDHSPLAPATTSTPTSAPGTTPATTTAPATTMPPGDLPVLAVGDSVLLAASPALDARFGSSITVDAAVGRQVAVGLDRIAAYRSSGALQRYHTVVVDLGTNGAFSPAQFEELVRLLSGVATVVVFDVHADRPWAATSNETIAAGVADHPGWMHLADWDRAAGSPGLLYDDGIHPNSAGAAVYAQLLVGAVRATVPAPTTTSSTSATTTVAPPPPGTAPPVTARPAPVGPPSTSAPPTTRPAGTSTTTTMPPRPPGG